MTHGTGLPDGAGWRTEACAFASLAASNLSTAWTQARWSLQYLLSSLGIVWLNRLARYLLFPSNLRRAVRKALNPPMSVDELLETNVSLSRRPKGRERSDRHFGRSAVGFCYVRCSEITRDKKIKIPLTRVVVQNIPSYPRHKGYQREACG